MKNCLASAACLVASITACTFDTALPAGAQLTCTDDGDCPVEQSCLSLVGRCVDRSGADTTPPEVREVALSSDRLAAEDILTIAFAADEALLVEPVIEAGAARPRAEAHDGGWRASIRAADMGEGFVPVTAALVDVFGNVAVAVLGIVEVDIAAPDVLPDSVRWEVEAPPGAVPLHSDVLTLRSRASLAFQLDDLDGQPVAVFATHPSGAAADFAFDERLDSEWRFDITITEALPEGEWQVAVRTRDVVGNEREVPLDLPAPGFVVANILTGACLARHDDGSTACTDLDADGAFGASAGCSDATDCDDTRTQVHPGSVEVPGNGLDDDCDGEDPPLDARAGVFVSTSGRAGAAGTPDDPFASIHEAALSGAMMFVQQGTYVLEQAEVPPSLIGGYDEQWRIVGVTTLIGGNTGNMFRGGNNLAKYRLEGVAFVGENCGGVAVGGEPAQLERVSVQHHPSACVGGEFVATVDAGADLLAVSLVVDADGTSTAISGLNGVQGNGALTLVDSQVRVVDGTRAVLGSLTRPATLVRTDVEASISFDAPLFGVEGQGPIVLAGVSIRVASAGGSTIATTGAELSAVHVSATIESPGNTAVCFASNGLARVWSSRCTIDATASASGVAALSFDVRGSAFGLEAASCTVRTSGSKCVDVEAFNGCALAGCVTASDNVATAPGVAAPGIPVVDLGAHTAIAMDSDGDCRGATEIEAGSDEVP